MVAYKPRGLQMTMAETEFPEEVDVVIVGAGRAGLAVATLVSPHMDSLVADSSRIPRRKPCTSLLVEEGQQALEEYGLHIPRSVFLHPPFLSRRVLDLDNCEVFRDPNRRIANLDQFRFDKWLVQTAMEKGARVIGESALTLLKRKSSGFETVFRTREGLKSVRSRFVVGADGPNSTLRWNIAGNRLPSYIACEFKCTFDSDSFVQIFGGGDEAYYSWIVPKDEETRLGFALKPGLAISKAKLARFGEALQSKLGYEDPSTAVSSVHPITFLPSGRSLNFGSERMLLVGEAAGWISPSSLDGISFALRSGFSAGRALLANMENPQEEYASLTRDLLEEIRKKLHLRAILENPVSRRSYLSQNLEMSDESSIQLLSPVGDRFSELESYSLNP